MSLWSTLCWFCRKRDGNHEEISQRLAVQEQKASSFERRIKRVEIELGIIRPDVVDEIEGTA